MKKKAKMNLEQLQVKSFITQAEAVRGGVVIISKEPIDPKPQPSAVTDGCLCRTVEPDCQSYLTRCTIIDHPAIQYPAL